MSESFAARASAPVLCNLDVHQLRADPVLSASTLLMSGIVLSKSWAQTNSRSRRIVVMGQVGLSFYQVKAALIQMVLELGYTVEVREGSREQIFPLLGTGKIDLLVQDGFQERQCCQLLKLTYILHLPDKPRKFK